MTTRTLEFDLTTEETINRLKEAFRVQTVAQVISRAIALAEEARKQAGSSNVIILSGQEGATKIDLAR